MKHEESEIRPTPGPWEFDGESDVSAHAQCIAQVFRASDFPCVNEQEQAEIDAECLANGRLIAAAPQLREAVVEAVKYLSTRPDHTSAGIRILALLNLAADKALGVERQHA